MNCKFAPCHIFFQYIIWPVHKKSTFQNMHTQCACSDGAIYYIDDQPHKTQHQAARLITKPILFNVNSTNIFRSIYYKIVIPVWMREWPRLFINNSEIGWARNININYLLIRILCICLRIFWKSYCFFRFFSSPNTSQWVFDWFDMHQTELYV